MDGSIAQQRIYAGFAKAAAKVGRAYAHYRAALPISPIEPGNLLGSVNCLFAADKRFEVPQKYKIPARYPYADGGELQQRDILVGPYGTFYVGDMQPLLPLQAIRCNEVVSITRPVYQGTEVVPEQIALGLPCFRQLKKVDQKPVGGIGGASNSSTPIGEWFLFAPIDHTLVRQSDVITDAGGRIYTLDTIDPTEIGTVLTMRQSDTAP